jgi:hypothetical protein
MGNNTVAKLVAILQQTPVNKVDVVCGNCGYPVEGEYLAVSCKCLSVPCTVESVPDAWSTSDIRQLHTRVWEQLETMVCDYADEHGLVDEAAESDDTAARAIRHALDMSHACTACLTTDLRAEPFEDHDADVNYHDSGVDLYCNKCDSHVGQVRDTREAQLANAA